MKCPLCATEMDQHARHGVTIDHCPACGGVWLEKGELDHLMAALRPAVTLQNPDPAPARPKRPPRPPRKITPAQETVRGPGYETFAPAPPQEKRYTRLKKKAARPDEREGGGSTRPRRAKRYARRYSKSDRIKDILEDLFDFD